jgi:hypothetical protein
MIPATEPGRAGTALPRTLRHCAPIVLLLILSIASCSLFEPVHSVIYDKNSATSGEAPVDSSTYRRGDRATIKSFGTLALSDHYFAGWSPASGGGSQNLLPGDRMTIGTEDVTLYAQWLEYDVHVQLNREITVNVSVHAATEEAFTIVTALPLPANETNSVPSDIPFTIESTVDALKRSGFGTGTGEAPRVVDAGMEERYPVYGRGQIAMDRLMRAAEEAMLSNPAMKKAMATPRVPARTAVAVGDVWNDINIFNSDNVRTKINATCSHVSDNAFFYVDNRDIAAMETLLPGYGSAFDAIHAMNRDRFGNEGDADSNGKVAILFSRELSGNFLGYFSSADKFARTIQNPYSNEADIFYMTAEAGYQGNIVKATLAHELQHMTYFNEHWTRNAGTGITWLNEALSQAAEYYNGYLLNHEAWMRSFLKEDWPGLSLVAWTDDNYGYGAVFIRYLIDRFGTEAVRKMCATDKAGIAAVETATGQKFNDIFLNFIRALVISGTGDSDDPDLNFSSVNLANLQPVIRRGLRLDSNIADFQAGATLQSAVKPYGIAFNGWEGALGTMKLRGSADLRAFSLGLSR